MSSTSTINSDGVGANRVRADVEYNQNTSGVRKTSNYGDVTNMANKYETDDSAIQSGSNDIESGHHSDEAEQQQQKEAHIQQQLQQLQQQLKDEQLDQETGDGSEDPNIQQQHYEQPPNPSPLRFDKCSRR